MSLRRRVDAIEGQLSRAQSQAPLLAGPPQPQGRQLVRWCREFIGLVREDAPDDECLDWLDQYEQMTDRYERELDAAGIEQ